MKCRHLISALLAAAFESGTSFADVVSVGGPSPNYANLQDAINHVVDLEASNPKYASPVLTCIPASSQHIFAGPGAAWLANANEGDQISLDGTVWYEIIEVLSDTEMVLNRENELPGSNCAAGHEINEVHTIEIYPGSYAGPVYLTGAHFLRMKGIGPRESVYIHGLDDLLDHSDTVAFTAPYSVPVTGVEQYGALYFENLTLDNPHSGAVLKQASREAGSPNMDVYFDNCLLLANFGDNLTNGTFGNLEINDCYLRTTIDVVVQSVKTLKIHRSEVASLWDPDLTAIEDFLSGINSWGISFAAKADSLIEDSSIRVVHVARNLGNPATNGVMTGLRVGSGLGGSNPAPSTTVTVRDSDITVLAIDGFAVHVMNNSTINLINSRINGRGSNVVDLKVEPGSTANIYCTDISSSSGGGTINFLSGCP